MGILKDVLVKIQVFMLITDALDMIQYITDCVNAGSKADLYKNPNINTAFYDLGTEAAENIQTAIDDCAEAPSGTNKSAIKNKVVAGKMWLKDYSALVEPIANADANRDTREEAATNILASHLTPQKLISSKSGDPGTPVITGKNTGAGNMVTKVVSGVTYIPKRTSFVAVRLPKFTTEETPDPVVTLANGQLKIVSVGFCETIIVTATGKGTKALLTATTTGFRYAIYAYSQNSKKQVSKLSLVIIVTV